jgi:hypothetical protein
MNNDSIKLHLSVKIYTEFTQILKTNGINFEVTTVKAPPGAFMNAIPTIELLNILTSPEVLTAFTMLVCAYLKAKSDRQFKITTKDNEIFDAKGYSQKEIEKLLSSATRIHLIDTEKGGDKNE